LKIIDFLMDNIYIVVIIFGALASLFSKAGAKKKPSQMPDFGGGSLPSTPTQSNDDWKPGEQQRYPEQAPETQSVYQVRTEPERRLETPRKAVPTGQLDNNNRASAPSTARERVSKVEVEHKVNSVTADDMRKAIVWAEILGPPRSKRPYRR